jgi:hypothetical protein
VGALRYQIVRLVELGLSDVEAALDGTRDVSPQQAVVFLKLLDKVLPRAGKAIERWLESNGTPLIDSLSVADLERMLAETLGEERVLHDSCATARAAPAPYCERDRREYFRNYERQHPERKKQREQIRRRRQKSLIEVRARIQARKAREAAEIMPTRTEDKAKRCGLAWKVKRQRWHEAERRIQQAQKRKKQTAGRGNAGPGQSACPQSASMRPPSALATWRGVRLDCLHTPLTQLVADVTGGRPIE